MSGPAAYAEESRAPARAGVALARFKWVIGTPYFVQGTSNLASGADQGVNRTRSEMLTV